jgi:hypothetical protein
LPVSAGNERRGAAEDFGRAVVGDNSRRLPESLDICLDLKYLDIKEDYYEST